MEGNRVLATVNGKEITEKDVDLLLKNLGSQRAMQFYSEEGRKKLVDELINQELIYLDALENKLDSDEEFLTELEYMRQNLLKQFAVRKLLENVSIEEEELVAFYNSNKTRFKKPEMVRARHILVDTESEANRIIEEIKKGLNFEEAAKKYSKCPSKANGGDLGYFTRGKMVKEFESASFELEKGQMSEPVKTSFGYHIIEVLDKKEEEVSPFEAVKEQIKNQLIATKQNEVYFKKVDKLRNTYEVKKYL
ncbi:peptidylprolyl isomerase [Caloranaerobacter azorensis]|uniref:Peptidylprolyl isomerase n=1 Tax=Caloranaerobacter azorensis TaxID=116090 RepID=A0A6P1YBZ8_9FIRM|nr:peptidylprolyl isomerase [Caloranaerobacter azorensis]QIB26829.1 peptidylprolyl isomerase [Caloranaerobacter azorensis]